MSASVAHRFSIQLRRPTSAAILEAPPRQSIAGGAPPAFGGTDDVWSPEHLLVSAVALCFLTTFEFFARRAGLQLADFTSDAEGTVEKTPKGLAFTGIRLAVNISVPAGEAVRARKLAATAERSCLISNSLACPVEVEVHEGAAAALAATP